MKTIRNLIICSCLFCGLNVFSQDPSFSQFYGNQTYFNPAYVGLNGGSTLNFTYRRHWVSVPSKFETMYFNYDSDISGINGLGGIGISAYKDVEGAGFLKNQGLNLMLAHRSNITYSSYLQLAVQGSLISNSVDWSKFTFGDQFDPLLGNINSTSFIYPNDNTTNYDFTIGGVFVFGEGPKKGLRNNNFDIKVGVAAHHIVSTHNSFLGQDVNLPINFIAHVNADIALNRDADFILSPCIVYQKQESPFEIFPWSTLMIGYNMLWGGSFFIGNWIRLDDYKTFSTNTNSLSFTVGYVLKTEKNNESNVFKFYYCYDLSLSGLGSSSGGSHEISIVYHFTESLNTWLNLDGRKGKHKNKKAVPCSKDWSDYYHRF